MNADELEAPKIPTTLEECFTYLDTILRDKEEFKITPEEEVLGLCHFSLGMWMRNTWYLWWSEEIAKDCLDKDGYREDGEEAINYPQEKPLLVKYFNDDLNIHHADDMSSIIITSYHRRLNEQSLNLDQQVKRYQDHWNNIPKHE